MGWNFNAFWRLFFKNTFFCCIILFKIYLALCYQKGNYKSYKKNNFYHNNTSKNGVHGEIRTHDLKIRNFALYPAELRGRKAGKSR